MSDEPHPVRLGYVLPNSWGVLDPRSVVDLAVQAEALGADSVWASHHVLHAGFIAERLGRQPYYDPLVTLAAVAIATERVQLGTSVLVLPYVEPVPTAKALASIDHLSAGRLQVGVGVGGLRQEHDNASRVPWASRGRYADECIDVMRSLWQPGPTTFVGEFVQIRDAEAYPGPVRPGGLPILVGGGGPAAMRRATRRGDGWHGVRRQPEEAAVDRAALARILADTGRGSEGFPFQLRLHVSVDACEVGAWRERVIRYAEAGVTELVLAPQSGDVDNHRRWLDTLVPALAGRE